MGLQLRLTHPLGERLIDLEARPMQRPAVVGRAADADVEVPSSEVSKRHCLIYTEAGRWFVVDARSTAGTYVNGNRLTGAARLESGQVIALGSGANSATLVVDPFGLGVAEAMDEGAEGPAARPAASVPPVARARPAMPPPPTPPVTGGARGVVLPPPPPATLPRPAYGAPGGYRPAAPTTGAPAAPAKPADEWADVPQTTHLYVPKRKGASPTTIAVTIVLTLGLLIGAGWYLKREYDRKQYEAEHPQVIVITKTRPRATTTAVASSTEPAPTTQRVVRVRSAAPEAAPPPAATEPAAPDPRRQDAEWQAVEQARYEEPVIGIVKFNDYLDRFPDSPFKADVARYTDEAVDRIWWNRIAELFAQRDAARKEIADRRVQLKQSQDPEFKKGLEEEIARFEQQVKDVDGIVRGEMKYAGQTPPNLYDSNELKILRANRDAKNYATWKDAVLSSVKRSRGERLPWRSSR